MKQSQPEGQFQGQSSQPGAQAQTQAQAQNRATAAVESKEAEEEEEEEEDVEQQGEETEQGKKAREMMDLAADLIGMDRAKFQTAVKEINSLLFGGKLDQAKAKEEELWKRLKELEHLEEKHQLEAERILQQLKEERLRARKAWLEAEEERKRKLNEEADQKKRERLKKLEMARQRWLSFSGVCCAGFAWIHKGDRRYNCSAGGHWMTVPGDEDCLRFYDNN